MAIGNMFAEFNANTATMGAAAAPLARLSARLQRVSELQAELSKIRSRVAFRLIPFVRGELARSYAMSRLGSFSKDYKPTGQLRQAVLSSTVNATQSGLRIAMPAGLPANLYARAGALEYGSVRGLKGGKSVRKRAARLLRQVGRKAEAKLGGMSYVGPHEYYNIDSGMSELEQLYAQFFQEEVDAFMADK